MAKKHKPRRGSPDRKRDVLLLTCILRLRSQPSVPYHEITSLLLSTFPTPILCLYEKSAPRGAKQYGILPWLEGYLEERFDCAEQRGSEPWIAAVGWDSGLVREILRVCGFVDKGYRLAEKREMKIQIKWRREGDWRAGSTLIGRPERFEESEIVKGRFVVGIERKGVAEEALETHEQHQGDEVRQLKSPLFACRSDSELLRRLKRLSVSERAGRDSALGPLAEGTNNEILELQGQQHQRMVEESKILEKEQQEVLGVRRVKSRLYDPAIEEEGIRFDTHQNAFPARGCSPETRNQHLSHEARMHSGRRNFSEQLEEIRAMEDALKARAAQPGCT